MRSCTQITPRYMDTEEIPPHVPRWYGCVSGI
nr:MAG TPA: hypothetical protein [Bacteriophage sp.]